MTKKMVFVCVDFEGNEHYYTKENIKDRNKDWRLVGVKNVDVFNPIVLNQEEFEKFKAEDTTIKEKIFDGAFFIKLFSQDAVTTLSIVDEDDNITFEVAFLDANYSDYLLGMKLISKKVDLLLEGESYA